MMDWLKTSEIPELQLLDICIAYESGFGHGLKRSGYVNPYPEESPSAWAYAYGERCGLEKSTVVDKSQFSE